MKSNFSLMDLSEDLDANGKLLNESWIQRIQLLPLGFFASVSASLGTRKFIPIIAIPKTRNFVRPFSNESTPPQLDKALRDRLAELTTRTRVVVLMKGNPAEPRCGFSNAVCRILEAHGVLGKQDPTTGTPLLSSFDVLSDSAIREGAKLFSDWPTFPQVFFDGEFVGGCDIILDMHRSGKLASELERRKIGSLLSEKAKKKEEEEDGDSSKSS